MLVFRGHITRIRDAFGILSRVLFTCFHHNRTDLGNTYTSAWTPAGLANGEKPYLTQGLDDGASWASRLLGFSTAGITVQVPKDSGLGKSSKRFRHYEPAANVASGSLANWKAPARRRLRKSTSSGCQQ